MTGDSVRPQRALTPESLAARRSEYPDTAALVSHDPNLAGVQVDEVAVAGRHGAVPCRRYRHRDHAAEAALVWVHGGGFVMGDLDMPESHWVGLTLAAHGVTVLAVDYRKCVDEEVHFPIPSDDVLDAWNWASEDTDGLGVEPSRLHLGGASAGAALAAGVTKRLRDGAGPVPASLVLAYPIVHPTLPPPSAQAQEAIGRLEHNIFTPELVRGMNLRFAGSEEMLEHPHAFAANGDVSGQPPVYVLNSEADGLRPSGEAYAAQLGAAGVPVVVEFEPGSGHGHLNNPFEEPAQRSVTRIGHWLRGQARKTPV